MEGLFGKKYAYMDIAEPIRIAIAKPTQMSNPELTAPDYHPITSDYSRIHQKNLSDGSYKTEPQFCPEDQDLYPKTATVPGYVVDFMTTPASAKSELVLWQHTHIWNFYRDESTKRLYAYCEENADGSNCEFAWKLEKGRNLDDVKADGFESTPYQDRAW